MTIFLQVQSAVWTCATKDFKISDPLCKITSNFRLYDNIILYMSNNVFTPKRTVNRPFKTLPDAYRVGIPTGWQTTIRYKDLSVFKVRYKLTTWTSAQLLVNYSDLLNCEEDHWTPVTTHFFLLQKKNLIYHPTY